MNLKKPKRPLEYSEKTWRSPDDHKMALEAYYNALAIYDMFELDQEREGK
jgi:hypothetical protein